MKPMSSFRGTPAVEHSAAGLSVICVFNNEAVLADCLDRSIRDSGDPAVELIAVDNRGGLFSSAGAALNHGARLARHDVLCFVHQDVYLHSISRLLEIGSLLGDDWGLIGAAGIRSDGLVVGRLRDRVQLIGAEALYPVQVDSVDEVLFMVRREQILEHPLSEHPDLSWHAYAVEYGVRLRKLGLRTGAADLAITHNSLTINLAKLDRAHTRVALLYEAETPIVTTCGVIRGENKATRRSDGVALLRRNRWRWRWLKESLRIAVAHRPREIHAVLADIRLDFDDLPWSETSGTIINIDESGKFRRYIDRPVQLMRFTKRFDFYCVQDGQEAVNLLCSEKITNALLTNFSPQSASTLFVAARLEPFDLILGAHEKDLWALVGPICDDTPKTWTLQRATPFRIRLPRFRRLRPRTRRVPRLDKN